MDTLAILVVFLPLVGALLGSVLESRLSQIVTCGFMALAAACAGGLFVKVGLQGKTFVVHLFKWIHVELFEVNWGLLVDSLSLVMMGVVTLISFLVHVYSVGYMNGDRSIPRFMAYLSLFTFLS